MRYRGRVGALAAALAVSGGAIAASTAAAGGAHANRSAGRHAKTAEAASSTPDQARRRDLPGERLVRPLLRHLSERGEHRRPAVHGAPGTPAVDGLPPATDPSLPPALQHTTDLLTPTRTRAAAAARQQRDRRCRAAPGGQLTCDQDHNYSDEQQAFDGGTMDQFVQSVGTGSRQRRRSARPATPAHGHGLLRRQHRHRALELRPALRDERQLLQHDVRAVRAGRDQPRLGQHGRRRHGARGEQPVDRDRRPRRTPTSPPNGLGGYSLTSDAQPYWDDCSTRDAVALSGTNIGDELNAAGLSWGWFQGGFRPTTSYQDSARGGRPRRASRRARSSRTSSRPTPSFQNTGPRTRATRACATRCTRSASRSAAPASGATRTTTSRTTSRSSTTRRPPTRTISRSRPTAAATTRSAGLQSIGHDTQSLRRTACRSSTRRTTTTTRATSTSSWRRSPGTTAASALPAVTSSRRPGYQDGHAAYSDPADEQQFIANEINALSSSPDWTSTAVIVNYDDSDGWYDHVYSGVINPSLSPADNLTNTTLSVPSTGTSGQCGPSPQTTAPLGGQQGRCGFGPRLPMLVISPFASATRSTTTSATRPR